LLRTIGFPHKRSVLRRVDPEILDELPSDDPEAIRSRRDLRVINAIMGNQRWLARRIGVGFKPGWRVLELGAGEGRLGRYLVKSGRIPASQLAGIDRVPRSPAWPAEAEWIQGDVFVSPLPPAEIVTANLFLHHFEPHELAELGRRLPSACRLFVCSEPARRQLHVWQGNLLAFVGRFNRVTRHDMPTSVRAGFLGHELPERLGISDWQISVSKTFFGAYRMEAHRP
jgi:hypothetical protein